MDTRDPRPQLASLHSLSFGWALACCRGDRARAEDVLQLAYLKVLEGRARFAGQSAFKTWLFGVIRNTAREEGRRHLLRRAGLVRYERTMPRPMDPAKASEAGDTTVVLRAALRRLSPRQQEILHLVFYQALTIEEAATVMAISIGSARTHYERGKRQLRKRLGSGGGDEA